MEHTPTPWYCDGDGIYSNADCEGAPLAHVLSMGYDNGFRNIDARRIVACINACAGLDTEQLEKFGLGTAFGTALFDVTAQRDELQQQLATERASLFAESQRKQQLEQQVVELVGVLEGVTLTQEEIDMDTSAGDEQHAAARAVIQKVRGGE